ncbi:magnesium/cobalt transporter CorA [Pontibacter cellulosilyticus]|uniref:Magnesium transport protein CorA n=1 Tax=Pontibacter cellulosilyticus TaxID=1720253 RepID=A0A923N7I8_9BACT|nr:magnesium/cobalt transporter CorA [Pontibacter cellulosilyticus]MBC5993207.1 magnesium/cobalt transporter CorA [Pontibacter cellulosilyticus]
MAKIKFQRKRNKILERKAGIKPGSLVISAEAYKPRFFLISFSETHFEESELNSYQELIKRFKEKPNARHWIDIRGYGDQNMLEQFILDFTLHPLQMEDVINDYQRPKVEEFGENRLFIITRMLRWSPEFKSLVDVQLSIFTGANYILTLQSDYGDCLDPLRERIRIGKGVIRTRPTMYMAYAVLDVVLDYYFPVMAEIGHYMEELEQKVLRQPSKSTLTEVLDLKSELVKLRRITWPERDLMNELLRMDDATIPDSLKVYFRDAYDHAVQLIDLVENHREMSSSLVELYMSTVSNRMNEIMKVLTIISSIFIPLSFIVGLYGMNFAHEDPETGRVFRYSMPELYEPYSYPILLGLMGILILFQLYFFYKKGWFRSF